MNGLGKAEKNLKKSFGKRKSFLPLQPASEGEDLVTLKYCK